GAYCVAHPQMFTWYLVPPLALSLLAFVVGAGATLGLLPQGRQGLAVAGGGGLILVALVQGIRLERSFPPTPRILRYRTAIEMPGAAAQDRTVMIGALEIGALGYYSRARILDHFGLVSPDVPRLGTAGAIIRYQPHFYVGYERGMQMGEFNKTPAFVDNYDLVARIPAYAADGSP